MLRRMSTTSGFITFLVMFVSFVIPIQLRSKAPESGNRLMNCRIFLILIAMLACQFTLSGRAEAQWGQSTAHCLGNIQDSSGNVVADLNGSQGYVSVYT